MESPQTLYDRVRSEITNIVLTMPATTTETQLQAWMTEVSRVVCQNHNSNFFKAFHAILEEEVRKLRPPQQRLVPTPEEVCSLDPKYWMTIKVHRDDWNGIEKTISRYSKKLVKPYRYKVIDP